MGLEKEIDRLALRVDELRKQSVELLTRSNTLLEEIAQRLEDLNEAQERAAGLYTEEKEEPS